MHDRDLKSICRALGDVTRLNIVRHLASTREVHVTEVAERMALSQPLASWHLRILRKSGILETRKIGRQVYCSLDWNRFAQYQEALGELISPDAASMEQASLPLMSEVAPLLAE